MYKQIDSNKRKTVILMAVFIIFVLGLGWLFGYLSEMGSGGVFFAAIISSIMAATSYYAGDKIALSTAGAKEIAKADNPYVYRMVENLCLTAGMPVPKVYIIYDPNINAFATGRDPQHASIAITQGAINKLQNEELEGVIGHELSHIKNYDIRLMMVIIVLIGIIALMSDWLMHGFLFRKNNREGGNLGLILLIAGIVLAILSPIIAQLIQLAVSRRREYLADADGSLLTRYPQGLANALEKIGQENVQPMNRANNATAHLYIASPFGQTKKLFSTLFATHPPLEDRIAQLRSMA